MHLAEGGHHIAMPECVACLVGRAGAPDVDRITQSVLDPVCQLRPRDRHGYPVRLGISHETDVAADERGDDDQAYEERLQPGPDGTAAPVVRGLMQGMHCVFLRDWWQIDAHMTVCGDTT
ncbi:hypothetical protein [Streptomyces sp. NPDC052107]|uniref:hypothetical protein n=1 Tax=Streptomyces sp. NPDC052107 TaxID=3155632 RepID=UPI003418BA9B